jgi:LacI family transcriptional regulator
MLRPTMRDVAERAGVSLKTVSRVVNGEAGVRQATLERVEDAIRTLGFMRNDLARSLRHGQTSTTIGLVFEDLANPFYSAIARAAEEVAREHGHLLIASSSEGDPSRERELIVTLAMRRVSGLLLVPSSDDQRFLLRQQGLGFPTVFLDRPPRGVEADAVLIDNVGGAYAAVAHLLRRGHRRIGIVGDPISTFTTRERLAGYHRALAELGVPQTPDLECLGPHHAADAEAAARRLLALPDPPTAIFTTNNRNTLGVLHALRDHSSPVALVGFDDFEFADLLATPVSVVSHDPGTMGHRGAELLFRRLAGDSGPPRREVLPTTLVKRGSGEVRPA